MNHKSDLYLAANKNNKLLKAVEAGDLRQAKDLICAGYQRRFKKGGHIISALNKVIERKDWRDWLALLIDNSITRLDVDDCIDKCSFDLYYHSIPHKESAIEALISAFGRTARDPQSTSFKDFVGVKSISGFRIMRQLNDKMIADIGIEYFLNHASFGLNTYDDDSKHEVDGIDGKCIFYECFYDATGQRQTILDILKAFGTERFPRDFISATLEIFARWSRENMGQLIEIVDPKNLEDWLASDNSDWPPPSDIVAKCNSKIMGHKIAMRAETTLITLKPSNKLRNRI